MSTPPTNPDGEPTDPTRWHPCAVCTAPDGTLRWWPYICCATCSDGLEEALVRAYEEYRARRGTSGTSSA